MQTLDVRPRRVHPQCDLIDAVAIDDAWKQACLEGHAVESESLIIDLSAANHLSHDCLFFVAGLIRSRVATTTLLHLPQSTEVIDTLIIWDFPTLISSITGGEFEESLTADSAHSVRESKERKHKDLQRVSDSEGGREELLSLKHFAILPLQIEHDPSRTAAFVKSHWLNRHVLELLDQYLNKHAVRIATHIVHEAVLNAASHPGAKKAFTSSRILSPCADKNVGRQLEIAIWDDGKPFNETLADALERYGTITSPAFGSIKESFEVRVDRGIGEDEKYTLDNIDGTAPTSQSQLLVAAFMLGTTSLKQVRVHEPNVVSSIPQKAIGHSGIGLFLIRRTVIDLFKGSIRYITGRYRVEMTGTGDSVYGVSVSHHDSELCPIVGNLLIVNIPFEAGDEGNIRTHV